jgi:hypothetical protein
VWSAFARFVSFGATTFAWLANRSSRPWQA